MKTHGIPPVREGSPQYLRYDEELFTRRIGGESLSPTMQYNIAATAARHWSSVAKGRKYRVVDIGCGHGYLVRAMNDAGLDASGLNVSSTEAMLATYGEIDPQTKEMTWQAEKKADIVQGSALALPYGNESLDGISCYGMLMMLPRSEKLLGGEKTPLQVVRTAVEEMHRVLKPGGHLDLVTFGTNAHHQGQRTEDYIFFGEEGYFVVDKSGNVVEKGDEGLRDLMGRFETVELWEAHGCLMGSSAYK